MAKADIGARLKGLRRLPPADAGQDEFYNGLHSIAPGAVLQPSPPVAPIESEPEKAAPPTEASNVIPAVVNTSELAAETTGQGASVRQPRRTQPISAPKLTGAKNQVRVGIIVRPDYASRIAKFGEKAKSTPDEVVRRLWSESKRAILEALPQTAKTMAVTPTQRGTERGLYLGTTITLESAVLEAIAGEHDPLGVHGHAKLLKCAITPEFEKAIDAELKKAGF